MIDRNDTQAEARDPGRSYDTIVQELGRLQESSEGTHRQLLQRDRELAAVAAVAQATSSGQLDLAGTLEEARIVTCSDHFCRGVLQRYLLGGAIEYKNRQVEQATRINSQRSRTMKSTHSANRLQSQLAHMIALEAAIEQRLEALIPEASDHAEATALLTGFLTSSKDHRQALETRLYAIADDVPQMKGLEKGFASNGLSEGADYPVSTALQAIYTMFNQAVIGYSVLHPLSTRFLDSILIADEGTSHHLSRQHARDYVQAIQQISRLLPDIVLWELDQEGLECQCTCPACSVGICLCAIAGRSFLSTSWLEAGPIADDKGVYVQLPKQNSAAAEAGLNAGDVILAAGGQELESYTDLQRAVRNAVPGDEIRLTVRRGSNELEDVAVVIL